MDNDEHLPDYTASSAEYMRAPNAGAAGYGSRRLLAWLAAAERGSLEELVVSTIAASSFDATPAQRAGYALLCRHLWSQLQSRIDPARHRRASDVPLALPFPLSQALVELPDPFSFVDPQTGLLEVGAELAREILDAFPDEDELVRMTLELSRAELLLGAERDEGHVLFLRQLEAHPLRWEPVDAYVDALRYLAWPRSDTRGAELWRRTARVIETALESGRPARDNGELCGTLREARTALAALPS